MAERMLPLPGGGWLAPQGGVAQPADAPARPPAPGGTAQTAREGAPNGATPGPRRATGLGALHLDLGGASLAVPAALAEHIHPMPGLSPLPGAAPGVAGLARAGGRAILVLDTAWLAGLEGAAGADPALLLALRWQGRRIGLPAARIAAGPEGPSLRLFRAWLDSPRARACLAQAPPALDEAVAIPLPERHLVLFRAGGLRAALPAEAVRAVLGPTPPQRLPGGAGFAAHRGDILPLRDAGPRLGGPPCWGEAGAPMIRLAEALLAVTAIEGVRRVPLADITPLGGGQGLVAALALVQGEGVPLLSPAALMA